LFLSFCVLILAFIIYNILKLVPNFHMIAIRNKDYLWSISDIVKHPLDPLIPHLKDVLRYYWLYLGKIGLILGLVGFTFKLKELIFKKRFLKDPLFLILTAWFFLPLIAQSAMGKVFTARYIFYGLPIMVVFIVYGLIFISKILRKRYQKLILIIALFIPFLVFDFFLLTNPASADLPADEYAGYLQDWTAGQGIKETAEYLKNLNTDNHIVIGTEGYFGTLPDGLQIYLQGSEDKITAIGVGYPIKEIPESLVNAKDFGDDVYLLVNKSRFKINDLKGLDVIKEYKKPGDDSLLFLRLK